ncbi:MAG: RDD family protein [Oscillospiraceae bacterium]|nr:RDD family protein [Oscillospiraceae bacterium]
MLNCETYQEKQLISAGFGVRLCAYVIDLLIQLILILGARVTFLGLGRTPLAQPLLFSFSALDIAAYFVGVSYFILFTYFTGVTIGKLLLSIKVISVEKDEEGETKKLSFFDVAFRETIGRYLTNIIPLLYIIIAFNPERRGLHDFMGNTRVVYTFNLKKPVKVAPVYVPPPVMYSPPPAEYAQPLPVPPPIIPPPVFSEPVQSFIEPPITPEPMPVFPEWKCVCGTPNTCRFCADCGEPRIIE